MASGRTLPGFVPALKTSKRCPASWRSSPSAIWLRAEFPVHRIKTRFFEVVPKASATARRTTAWFHGTDKRADEFTLDLRSNRIGIQTLASQKLPRILKRVRASWLDFDRVKARAGKLGDIVGILQRTGDAADPQFHAAPNFGRHVAAHHNIRDGKSAAGFQDPEGFAQNAVFVGGKIDDAIGNDDIDRVVRQRDAFDFALQELDVGHSGAALILA